MTRKRFCKLLMSTGISRNDAKQIVASIPEGVSYSSYFMYIDVQLRIASRLVSQAWEAVARILADWARSFQNALGYQLIDLGNRMVVNDGCETDLALLPDMRRTPSQRMPGAAAQVQPI